MDIYSKEELEKQKNIRSRAKLAMCIVSAAAFTVCIVLFCTVKPLNEFSHKVWASAALSAAAIFDVYICSFVLPYIKPNTSVRSKGVRVLRNILGQLLLYITCVILATIAVTFVFNSITDTVPAKKVSVYADVRDIKSAELETVLGEDLPDGIKMVKAHSFEYELFGFSGGVGDIYIVEESKAGEYIENFAPVSQFLEPRDIFRYYVHDGEAYGVLIHSGGTGGASEYIAYEEGKDYYMFFGKASVHPGTDGAASYIADRLLLMK